MTNQAVVQLLQLAVLCFYVLLTVAAIHARLHWPQTKWAPLLDVMLIIVLWLYALGLKIYFST